MLILAGCMSYMNLVVVCPGLPRVSHSSVVRAFDWCAEGHRFHSCQKFWFFYFVARSWRDDNIFFHFLTKLNIYHHSLFTKKIIVTHWSKLSQDQPPGKCWQFVLVLKKYYFREVLFANLCYPFKYVATCNLSFFHWLFKPPRLKCENLLRGTFTSWPHFKFGILEGTKCSGVCVRAAHLSVVKPKPK